MCLYTNYHDDWYCVVQYWCSSYMVRSRNVQCSYIIILRPEKKLIDVVDIIILMISQYFFFLISISFSN